MWLPFQWLGIVSHYIYRDMTVTHWAGCRISSVTRYILPLHTGNAFTQCVLVVLKFPFICMSHVTNAAFLLHFAERRHANCNNSSRRPADNHYRTNAATALACQRPKYFDSQSSRGNAITDSYAYTTTHETESLEMCCTISWQ